MNQDKMVPYKVLIIVVLCCVHIGAGQDALGTSCGFLGNEGICTPVGRCPPESIMGYELGKILRACHSTVSIHHEHVVCCLKLSSQMNPFDAFVYNVNFLYNVFNSVNSRHKNINTNATVGLPSPTTSSTPNFPMSRLPSPTTSSTPNFPMSRLPTTSIVTPNMTTTTTTPQRPTISTTMPRQPTNPTTPSFSPTRANASITPPQRPATSTTTPRQTDSVPSIPSFVPTIPSTTNTTTTTTPRPVASTPRLGHPNINTKATVGLPSPTTSSTPTTSIVTNMTTTRTTPLQRPTTSATTPRQTDSVPSIPSFVPTIPSTTSTTTTTTPRPVATTPRLGSSTTEYMPPVYDYVTNVPMPPECREIDPKLTTAKTGQPAWDKCIEYQEQLVYPCEPSTALLGNKVRYNRCSHTGEAEDGVARPDEFPHMVVLGYRGLSDDPLQWACTGTLISEWFILTPAHCWAKPDDSGTLYATLGNYQRLADNADAYQEHKIQSKLFYGLDRGFQRTQDGHVLFHDIALLKTATEIRLNQWVVPACLDTYGRDTEAVAARWRAKSWHTMNAVQKTYLYQLGWKEYQTKFKASIRQRYYQLANQMAFASRYFCNDNCQFENEVSLTVENKWVHCMHTVVGLPSNPNATCGPAPANSFTKVYEYRSWIEANVWPM